MNNEFLKFTTELNNLENWDEIVSSKQIKIWKKRLFQDTTMETIKFETEIQNCTPEELVFLYYETEHRVKWNNQFIAAKIIKKISKTQDIEYHAISLPHSFLAPRDFLVERFFYKVDNGFDIFERKASDDYLPPVDGYVRGETIVQAAQIRKNGENTKIILMSQLKCKSI
jgi:hypothetical protein